MELVLTCDTDCAEQKLQLRVNDRPLWQIMEAVARLLPGTWKRSPKEASYTLLMDSSWVQRRRRWWDLFVKEHARALEAQRQHIRRELDQQSKGGKPGTDTTTEGDSESNAKAAAEHEVFRALPADIKDRIAADMDEAAWFGSPGPSELPGGTVALMSQLPGAVRQSVLDCARSRLPGIAEATGNAAAVRFTNAGLVLIASLILPDGRTVNVQSSYVGTAPQATSLWPDHERLPAAARKLGPGAPAPWQELLAYQESRVWPNNATHIQQGPIPRRSEWLNWLRTKSSIEFVADYYSRPGQPMGAEKEQGLIRRMDDELDYRSVQMDFSWQQDTTGMYLVRDNRWYRNDGLEVPVGLLRLWLKDRASGVAVERSKRPQVPAITETWLARRLDRDSAIVSSLSPWQVGNGLKWYKIEDSADKESALRLADFPFFLEARRILSTYRMSRFVASLPTLQRRALAGGRLRFADLSPELQSAALSQAAELVPLLLNSPAGQIMLGIRTKSSMTLALPSPELAGLVIEPELGLRVVESVH